jgi:hypothetical protein
LSAVAERSRSAAFIPLTDVVYMHTGSTAGTPAASGPSLAQRTADRYLPG